MESTTPTTAKGSAARCEVADIGRRRARGAGRPARVAAPTLTPSGTAPVSRARPHHYFSDRDGLMRAVARSTSDAVIDGQAELLAHMDTVEGIRAWIDAVVAMQEQREARGGCPIGSLAGQLAEHDDAARAELADGFDRWESEIRAGLEQMADRGELRADADPALLAQRTLAAAQAGLLLTQVRRDPRQLRAALDGARRLILAARRDLAGPA